MTLTEEAAPAALRQRHVRVRRYEPIERLAHWWVACCFVLTLLTGASVRHHGQGLISSGLIWHLISAGALILGLLLLFALPGRRSLWKGFSALLRLSAVDRKLLRSPWSLLHRIRGGPAPWGKYNLGQKLAAYLLALLFVGLYATGIAAALAGHRLGAPHGAFVALTVIVLLGHVFLALVNPSTRPALRGMLTGWVDRSWAEHHHPAWLEELEARDLEQQPAGGSSHGS